MYEGICNAEDCRGALQFDQSDDNFFQASLMIQYKRNEENNNWEFGSLFFFLKMASDFVHEIKMAMCFSF